MSSSSETSLAELPLPYDISSAVSKAFCIDHSASGVATAQPDISDCSDNSLNRMSSAGYPVRFMPNYNIQVPIGVHNPYSIESGDNCSAAASSYYCPANNPYPYYNPPRTGSSQYLYPHHQESQHYQPTAVHPLDPQVPMDMDAWNETAAMSICNSSSSMLLDSQENIEQLDKFCKYIDSSGDEDFMADKDINSMEGCSSGEGCSNDCGGAMLNPAKNRYECFIGGKICSEMLDSPPKNKTKNGCGLSISDYLSDDNMDPAPLDFIPPEDRNWKVELDNGSIWRQFDMVGTEMVITKAGRY